eukprot:4918348-Alexandrium_andersonii.AAC.1
MSLCRISLGASPCALARHLDRNTVKWSSYQAGSDCAQQVRLHWADQDISGAERSTVSSERLVSRMFERACARACVPALCMCARACSRARARAPGCNRSRVRV